jgi:hypothetical protein
MAKQVIRLTESDLHNIIRESVERILSEGSSIEYKDEYRNLTPEQLSDLKDKMAAELKTPQGKTNMDLKMRYQAVRELLGATQIVNPDAYWSQQKNKELGKYTHDEWLRCDPRKRKDVKKKPKASEITKGREQIAKDAFEREKDLRRKEQGSMGAVAGD